MPRLIGKRSNPNPMIAMLFAIAIGTGISLEYLGYINLIPGFGQNVQSTSQQGNYWQK